MTRSRSLLGGLLTLGLAAMCVVGPAAYRLLLHPVIESVLSLDKATSSTVRRIDIFILIVASYWGFVRFYERRPVRELSPRWGWIVLAGAAGAASIGVTILALYATGHYQLIAFRGFGPSAEVFGTLGIAAVLEEVAFRGILFRVLEKWFGSPAAMAVSAVAFSVSHLENNGVTAITVVMVTLAGVMWAEVFMLTRNIWATAAHHFCWNATIFAIGVPLSGEEDVRIKAPFQTEYHGSALWTGGAFGPEDSVINVVLLVGMCVGLWLLLRRKQLLAAPRSRVGSGSVPKERQAAG